VNGRDVPHEANINIVRLEVRNRDGARGLGEEGGTVNQDAVRVAAQEVIGQHLIDAAHVAALHRADLILVQNAQRGEIGGSGGLGCAHA